MLALRSELCQSPNTCTVLYHVTCAAYCSDNHCSAHRVAYLAVLQVCTALSAFYCTGTVVLASCIVYCTVACKALTHTLPACRSAQSTTDATPAGRAAASASARSLFLGRVERSGTAVELNV
jgi:hypothetical protein